MDTENKDDLFSIRLTNEGAVHLLKFAKQVSVFMIAGIVLTIIILARDLIALLRDKPVYSDSFFRIFFSIYPYLSLAAAIAFVLQLIYYRKLGKAVKYAIEYSDEAGFNKAFENLVKGIWFAFLVTGFSFLFVMGDLVVIIKLWNK
jgi:hypothetical protein